MAAYGLKWFLKALLAGALLLGLASRNVRADDQGSTSLASAARVAVSTTPASPTTICSADVLIKEVVLINNNTDYILLGDADTTFSTSATTGTFRLPGTVASTSPVPFYLRGFRGTLKGVAGGSGPVNVDVLRTK